MLWLLCGSAPRWRRCCKVKLCVGGTRELHCYRESKDHYCKGVRRIVVAIGGVKGLEWPSPHDCTNSIWDEFKFIPIIGSTTCIEVGSFFNFFPSFTSRLAKKKSIQLPKHFKPQLPTSAPPKTLNLAGTQD